MNGCDLIYSILWALQHFFLFIFSITQKDRACFQEAVKYHHHHHSETFVNEVSLPVVFYKIIKKVRSQSGSSPPLLARVRPDPDWLGKKSPC